jgi:hypothetical protein
MKQYMVSFDVNSAQATLQELATVLGEPDPVSKDKGTERISGKVWERARWIMESKAGKSASLEEHLEALLVRIPLEKLNDGSLPDNCGLLMSIGVLYDTYTGSLRVPPEVLERLGEYSIALEVAWYPTDFS